jgi:hypothetical protein
MPFTRLKADSPPPTLTAGTAGRACFRLEANQLSDADAAVHTLLGVNATQLGYVKPALEGVNEMKSWRGNPNNCVDGQWRVFAFYSHDVARALNGYCWTEDIGGGLGARTLWHCRLRHYHGEKYGGLRDKQIFSTSGRLESVTVEISPLSSLPIGAQYHRGAQVFTAGDLQQLCV